MASPIDHECNPAMCGGLPHYNTAESAGPTLTLNYSDVCDLPADHECNPVMCFGLPHYGVTTVTDTTPVLEYSDILDPPELTIEDYNSDSDPDADSWEDISPPCGNVLGCECATCVSPDELDIRLIDEIIDEWKFGVLESPLSFWMNIKEHIEYVDNFEELSYYAGTEEGLSMRLQIHLEEVTAKFAERKELYIRCAIAGLLRRPRAQSAFLCLALHSLIRSEVKREIRRCGFRV
ncbi:hypothetical protein QBC34DRAFT_391735 [Podospora aff. communis PSN243]|uniref:Uncharacterized protein n=1 Tax=Podospora aff. communis PSN243 TaxID=3040156 RepID=A0AAV9H572_9PEZI|nr:hypothetical protein QBC34DRAFT_391735 [Podospora aff. communis PSN243]